MIRISVLALCAALATTGAHARIWKPTPLQEAQDYATITHIKGSDGRVVLNWFASTTTTTATMKDLLDKYVVINIVHTAPSIGGAPPEWIEVEGVQVKDAAGTDLKEIIGGDIPPALVGMIAGIQAQAAQATQGKAKIHWMVFQAGAVNACTKGQLNVTYAGETYSFDTPMPGCTKS